MKKIKTMKMNKLRLIILSISMFVWSCGDDEAGAEEVAYRASISGISSVSESDIGTFKISLDKVNKTGTGLVFNYDVNGTAEAGQDFQALAGSVTVEDGDIETTVTIPIIDDTVEEDDETIIILLNTQRLPSQVSATGATSLTITLIDNDDSGIPGVSCSNDNSTDQNNRVCDQTTGVSNTYSASINGGTREITTNGIPTHDYGNQIPKIVSALNSESKSFSMNANPVTGASITAIDDDGRPRYKFGVALNGVAIDPAPAEPFIFENTNTGEFNWDWVFEPNNNMNAVGLDCAIAHVQPDGTYHYHGDMAIYADQLLAGLGTGSVVPGESIQIGWAADGFPILYKFGPDASGNMVELTPGYQLKSGDRPGDGITAPCGTYNGKYTNDYEFVANSGDLDECNGIARSITLNGETFSYFYVITEAFPVISRCFAGSPNTSFRIGPG
ncbi:YHYH protein [Fulvivirga sp. M361]|uniref:YHYH protein n=1 Tax=Fulvivirga sp. M361 TaxID=2594266 RepID=UPI00117B57CA|nr:YHYH protein [Fulvivirga sp. M361]TRX61337.1 YHYH protein [Fulvivirga sp. M361]